MFTYCLNIISTYDNDNVNFCLLYIYIILFIKVCVTAVDVTTVANLELLRNIRDPRSEHTLFGILNTTKSRMGSRLLRVNILQPPCGIIDAHCCTEQYVNE